MQASGWGTGIVADSSVSQANAFPTGRASKDPLSPVAVCNPGARAVALGSRYRRAPESVGGKAAEPRARVAVPTVETFATAGHLHRATNAPKASLPSASLRLQVMLREFQELQPVEHLEGVPTGMVVVADLGFDNRFTDRW